MGVFSKILASNKNNVPFFRKSFGGGFFRFLTNNLFEGAKVTGARVNRTRADVDSKQSLNRWTRTEALSIARWCYANDGICKGLIDVGVRLSVGSGIWPISKVADVETAQLYTNYFREKVRNVNIKGGGYVRTLRTLAKSALVDGDVGVLFLKGKNGFRGVQIIGGHRIGGLRMYQSNDLMLNLWDGVFVDQIGKPLSYRVVVDDDGNTQDLSAKNFRLVGEFDSDDQIRGISRIVHGLNDVQDVYEILSAEKAATKVAAKIPFWIKSDSEPKLGNQLIDSVSGMKREQLYDATIPRLSTDESLEALDTTHPRTGLDVFTSNLYRRVSVGLGFPLELFAYMEGLRTPSVRLALSLAQRRFEEIQDVLIEHFIHSLYLRIISSGQQNGDLPIVPEWWLINVQRPRSITVDNGRDSQNNRSDIQAGLRTYEEDYTERGEGWRQALTQKAVEAQFIAQLSKQYGVPIDQIANFNPNGPAPEQGTGAPVDSSDK